MVRFKNRWLLLSLTFAGPSSSASSTDSSQAASASASAAAAVAAPPPPNLTPYAILQHLRASLSDNFGAASSGANGGSLAIRYWSASTRTAIVRCGRAGVADVVAACTLLASIEGRRVRIVVRHVGGTIRKVQEAAVRLDRRRIERAKLARRGKLGMAGHDSVEVGQGPREEQEEEDDDQGAMDALMQLKDDDDEGDEEQP
ncbi:hypothetical protein FA10DRAFT_266220 [Acaromyces ingoldii]|uniref:Uncharacterized protein n=1 Tax=Acaromyces ingoldii TaxID=215250 RepID=A0A316YTK5_9BASI|nr:hypothetical protein FA10DRAFT_266220 [Acaromyces ingoldii]PWN92462.1 hypothetical protein FA10DRAFT_266220 [Acaromyces ingoldii]